ncbi:DMT family transporter [Psychromonas sp. SR45-3]|uniref:DMT family transporter n=1 Tax=Psychromonas sp. SR45-3 TaxID=2760930 RepID=UPI0015F9FE45|nr:DMT family transporter [Psychromonas sp. SR45-3]MBB1274880.1 DMT family transporter [Psychromonas sp. SR45-3]
MNKNTQGFALAIFGVLLLAPDVVIMRWISIPHMDVIFWRGIGFIIGFSGLVFYRYKSDFFVVIKKAGWIGVASGLLFALGTYCYTISIQTIGAASTMVIISSAPIFAALINWLFLNQRMHIFSIVAIFFVLTGIVFIAFTDINQFGISSLLALSSAVFMAINFNLAQSKADTDISPGLIWGGIILTVIALFNGVPEVQDKEVDAVLVLINAIFIMPIGFTLLQIAPRFINATQTSVCLLLEPLVGPLIVFLMLGEKPGGNTFIGCAIIFVAVIYYIYNESIQHKKAYIKEMDAPFL